MPMALSIITWMMATYDETTSMVAHYRTPVRPPWAGIQHRLRRNAKHCRKASYSNIIRKPASQRSQTRSEVGKADGANLKTEPSSRDIVALVADKSSTRNISFDDIAFKMEKDDSFKRSMLTEKIVALADKSVRIRGFILPSFKQDGLTEFVLVRDNMECCFGPGAALYDCIMVRMQFGESTSFSVRPVAVEGRFSIEEWRDFDGVVRAIYHIQGLSVK